MELRHAHTSARHRRRLLEQAELSFELGCCGAGKASDSEGRMVHVRGVRP